MLQDVMTCYVKTFGVEGNLFCTCYEIKLKYKSLAPMVEHWHLGSILRKHTNWADVYKNFI